MPELTILCFKIKKCGLEQKITFWNFFVLKKFFNDKV